jgi:F-type H+-transporting ATPase subunit epsilon
MVICRTVGGGDIAFLPGHAPFVGALEIGLLTIRSDGQSDQLVAVHGGFVEVSNAPAGPEAGGDDEAPLTTVTVLSDVAELAEQIDVDRARQAQQRAEERVAQADDADRGEAQAALRRAQVRLAVADAQPQPVG